MKNERKVSVCVQYEASLTYFTNYPLIHSWVSIIKRCISYIQTCEDEVMNPASLTVFPDVPPASDSAQHATWEQGARGRYAYRMDIIGPGNWA